MKRINIILNIPHSSISGIFDSVIGGWEPDPVFINECVNIWTDWWTDVLFHSHDPRISTFVFPYSRFVCDVERLYNDPKEQEGQGIIYTSFNQFKRTPLHSVIREKLLGLRSDYLYNIEKIINESTVLIDCHSFPSMISDVEICIGVNEDWSCNSKLTHKVESIFMKHGYSTSLNEPYSNSLTPTDKQQYSSLMIEVNKKIYMDEETLKLKPELCQRWFKCISEVYDTILND